MSHKLVNFVNLNTRYKIFNKFVRILWFVLLPWYFFLLDFLPSGCEKCFWHSHFLWERLFQLICKWSLISISIAHVNDQKKTKEYWIMKTLMLLLKLVYLYSNKHLVPLLQGLEGESNMFMASSCLAPPGLSMGPTEKKTSFAASVSGLWFVFRADGQVSYSLHPVSTTRCSAGKWLDGFLFC